MNIIYKCVLVFIIVMHAIIMPAQNFDYLQNAKRRLKEGNCESAEKNYNLYTELNNKTSESFEIELGDCFFNNQQYDKALMYYQKWAEKGNAELQLKIGYIYSQEKNHNAAVSWYKKVEGNRITQARDSLGMLYKNKHMNDSAVIWFKQSQSEFAQKQLAKLEKPTQNTIVRIPPKQSFIQKTKEAIARENDAAHDMWWNGVYYGLSYNYSETFPLSLSLHFRRKLLFLGLNLGFNQDNKKVENTITDYNNQININGVVEYGRKYYSIDPRLYWGASLGLNIMAVTMSCGFGFMHYDYEYYSYNDTNNTSLTSITTSSTKINDYCWYLHPNIIINIPIIGTDGGCNLTLSSGYMFVISRYSEMSWDFDAYDGFSFGIGLEIGFD